MFGINILYLFTTIIWKAVNWSPCSHICILYVNNDQHECVHRGKGECIFDPKGKCMGKMHVHFNMVLCKFSIYFNVKSDIKIVKYNTSKNVY
jgi:hypothetical protein